jgi:spore germination protein (amino acid permease)
MPSREKITTLQFIFLIHGAQIGVGILTLPRELGEIADTDGWIAILFGWAIAVLLSILIIKTMEKHPTKDVSDIVSLYFGKWIGKIIILFLASYLSFFAFTLMLETMMLTKVWVLPLSNISVLLFMILIPTYMIASGGVKILGRYAELTFFITAWIIFMLCVPVETKHWINLLPIIKEGWIPIFEGAKTTIFSFLGLEIILFIYPYLMRKEKAVMGVVVANSLTMLMYMSATIICFMFYGPDAIGVNYEPVLNLVSNIKFRYIERIDLILLPLYIFVVSTTWIPYVFFTTKSLGKLFGKRSMKLKIPIFILLIVYWMITLLVEIDWQKLNKMKVGVTNLGIVVFGFAILLFLYSKIVWRKKRDETLEE